MAAFDRISCGIPELDSVFDNIRLGDNVVWQLSSLDNFPAFVEPFVEQCVSDKRPMIYVRFASHEPLVKPQPGVTIYELNPHKGFEAFTIEVREIITKEGCEACYVFDCLSELQAAWSADLMMGNFFRVTCPYLFELDTVAYFPIIRGGHSFQTIAKIRDTTQVLIDVYSSPEEDSCEGKSLNEDLYIHPLKMWNRYSETMFLAHRYSPKTKEVFTLTDGMEASKFYALAGKEAQAAPDRNTDSWDRFFAAAQADFKQGTLTTATCTKMCNMMISKDPKMREMVKRYFEPTDYFEVRNHMVGTGIIGGKACGMLLARKMIQLQQPEVYKHLEPHDSFYLGSDVFYSYLVANDLWTIRIRQRSEEGFIDEAPALKEGLLRGSFPEEIREHFMRILDYYGQAPIIVRSSSFLEDGFDNAFAGKYDSVFCANIGSPEERLAAFESAVRQVYASTMNPSALEYRRRNGLDRKEEQMALLVMRVSGSHYGHHLFMPTAAGVGYSHSTYRWSDSLDPSAGMLRLVAGLGTKAVDRTQSDYPRIVSLDKPLAQTSQSWADKHRYSQHNADVLDLEKRAVTECDVLDLVDLLPPFAKQAIFEHDREAEGRLRERGHFRPVLFASCQGLVENREFTTLMARLLSTLEECYKHPVDIEYTVNVGKDNTFAVNLLQCRPLHLLQSGKRIDLPSLSKEDTFFSIKQCAMGKSRVAPIDVVIRVDPLRYYQCPHIEKPTVARLIGLVNEHFRGTDKNCLLLVPGRIGTSSPELGVPVSFADVSNLMGICEVASSEAGYSPELSYGSHLFQDLVEADIYYGALLEDPKRVYYNPAFVEHFVDITAEVLPLSSQNENSAGDDADATGSDLSLSSLDINAAKPDLSLPKQDPSLSKPDPNLAKPNSAPAPLTPLVQVFDTGEVALTLWHDLGTSTSICGVLESS